jgi:fatty-acyl-CoA synthase
VSDDPFSRLSAGSEGLTAGDKVGLMCRDHRGFVEATLAMAKLGADTLLLNTSFAAPQLSEVCQREEGGRGPGG